MPDSATIGALKRQRTKRLIRLGAKVFYLRRRGKEQEMYDLICDEFVALGGVYVKFLQGVLFNTPMMKRWHSPNRLRIFENLDYEPLNIIEILQKELSPEQLQKIVLIQQEPFAAGSFGQVYLGQHADGTHIIVKVLRPMIRELLKHDLRLLSMFSKKFAGAEYENIDIRMNNAIKEFRAATLSETDYVAEAYFAQDLYRAYEENPNLIIPRTYVELCTPHIIVQEYIGGLSGTDLLRVRENDGDIRAYVAEKLGSNLDEQLRTLGRELIMGAFDMPRIQGDPHPGNLRFLPDNKVGMIDFGISAPAPRNKAAFFGILYEWSMLYNQKGSVGNMFEQFLRFFVNDLYRAIKKLNSFLPQAAPFTLPTEFVSQKLADLHTSKQETPDAFQQQSPFGVQPKDLLKEIASVVQNIFDGALGARDVRDVLNNGRMLQAFSQMVNRGNRLGLVVRLESSEVLRAAQTYITVLDTLGMMSAVLPRMLDDVVAQVITKYPEVINETERGVSTSQAVDTVNRWLERVAVRDPMLFRQLLGRIDLREAIHNAKEKTSDA